MNRVAEQQQTTLDTFKRVERLEGIAADLRQRDTLAANQIYDIADELVSSLRPVRVSVAASLLDVTKVTVEAWRKRGLLTTAEPSDTTVTTLDPHRLHDVMHVVNELRALGEKPGNLAEQVWHRLRDRALLEREDLQEGLQAWRDGDVVEA